MKKVAILLAGSLFGAEFTYSHNPTEVVNGSLFQVPKGTAVYSVLACREKGDAPLTGGSVYRLAPFVWIDPELASSSISKGRTVAGELLGMAADFTPMAFGVAVVLKAPTNILALTGGATVVSRWLQNRADRVRSLPALGLLGMGRLPLEEGECGMVKVAGKYPPTVELPVTLSNHPTIYEIPFPSRVPNLPKELLLTPSTESLEFPLNRDKLVALWYQN